ncbi:MAG: S8 family serine peptidase [Gemmatimonadales bacterium]
MVRPLRAAALLWLAIPASLAAQRPSVSPVLPRVWQRAQDTTLSVWLFARPGASLAAVADRAAALGARVRVRSRWLHAVSVDAPTPALRVLAQDRNLRRIQPLGRFRRRPDLLEIEAVAPPQPVARAVAAPGDTCGVTPGDDPVLGPSEMPYRRLHLRPLTDRGVDGAGVRVGIFDTGFDAANPAFAGITVTAQYDFVFGDSVVRNEAGKDSAGVHSHGTAVWSLFAGDVPGRLRGIARGAAYLLAKTEDVRGETRVEEDNYVAALEWADSIGVDIVSSSLAYLIFDNGFRYVPSELNGDVAVTTVAADMAAQRGILVVTAAGNAGSVSRSIWTPADGDSVLAIGAEDSLGNIASFSSRGPTADGRIKPDFTAPGVNVCAVTGVSVGRIDGTSFATPILAAAAALVKQLHPTLAPMSLRAAFRSTATNRAAPDTIRGWGTPDVTAAAVFPNGVTATAPLPAGGPLASITPTVTWTVGSVPAFALPVTFRLRVARDSALTAPLLDTLVDVEMVDLGRALKPGAPVYWRVDATAATGDTVTTGRIGPNTVPAWATLTSLSDPVGVVIDSVRPTFTWTSPAVAAPPGPFTYDLFVQRVADSVPEFGVAGLTGTSFRLPQPLEQNRAYRWALVAHVGADTSLIRSQGSFLVVDGSIPTASILYQNFPNPFPTAARDSTCLWFDLATQGLVELSILDLRGNSVRRFVPGPDFPAMLPVGRYGRGQAGGPICDPRLMWDGRADDGHLLPAGVYVAKLKAAGVLVFKRIVFRGK